MDGIVLRPLVSKHAEAHRRLVERNRGHLARSGDGWEEQLSVHPAAGGARFGIWEGGEVVGRVDLVAVAPPRYSIGYWLAEEATGRGIATEACRTAIEYARSALEATEVFAGIRHGNDRSAAVVQRLGFEPVVDFATYRRFHRWLVAPPAGRAVTLRPATAEDAPVLTRFLLLAATWSEPTPGTTVGALLADDHVRRYVEAWPRADDVGVVAEDGRTSPVGAAWCRRFSSQRPGYGFFDEATPELSIGVEPGYRGEGVGTRLLRAVHDALRDRGVEAVSLSVERANPARHLYERAGYRPVSGSDGSVTMRLARWARPPVVASRVVDSPPAVELTSPQARVLGALLEKELTTPDAYPLSLKALTTACNQTSNRDPVVAYQPREVETTVLALKAKGLARVVHPGSGERATKYRQVLDEVLRLTAADRALLSVLFLRGAQTVPELRARTERLHPFASPGGIEAALDALAERDPPLVARIDRASGQREDRWLQLLEAGAEARAAAPPRSTSITPRERGDGQRADLEERVSALESKLAELLEALGDEAASQKE